MKIIIPPVWFDTEMSFFKVANSGALGGDWTRRALTPPVGAVGAPTALLRGGGSRPLGRLLKRSLFAPLFPSHHKVSNSVLPFPFTMILLLHHGPQLTEPDDHRL